MTATLIRLLVCGGRGFRDHDFVFGVLSRVMIERGPIEIVMTGGAPGVDGIAGAWARENRIELDVYHADWSLGKKAGPLRNQRMIDEGNPNLVVAFRGSRGTEDMMRRAYHAGIEVIKSWPPVPPRNTGMEGRRDS